MEKEKVRLSKIMSQRKICSRREADRYIENQLVTVNGEVAVLGSKFFLDCKIELLQQAKNQQSSKVTILLNKPVGYVSTQPEKEYIPAIDLITLENQYIKDKKFNFSHLRKLSVAGRLDIDSKGLLVLTQDGTIAKKLIGPSSNIEKEYLIRVSQDLSYDLCNQLKSITSLEDKALKPIKVDMLQKNVLRIILREGKKRQIRKMCEMVNIKVLSLKRVRIGRVVLSDLPVGKWRYLSHRESF